jgi:serine protease Do
VLTNAHVITGGTRIFARLQDGRVYTAALLGADQDMDLAVLRLEMPKGAEPLPQARMGDSDGLMIGEPVVAIGNPFGLSHTVTTGVVSALHRSIQAEDRTYTDFIQTDASINPGNSGGPLLNIEGMLIGVNTAIYSKAQGIGFAIPIDKARRIVDDLMRYGEVRRPYYGFEVQELTGDLAEAFTARGLGGGLVSEVDPRGPAAGRLSEGDIITAVDGVRVADSHELRTRLGDFTAGARVALTLQRGGEERSAEVVPAVLAPEEAMRRLQEHVGLKLAELPESESRRARLPPKVIVVEGVTPNSPAWQSGIRRGDLVRAVNAEKVTGLAAFGKAIGRSYWRGQVILLIQRGRVWQQLAFDL